MRRLPPLPHAASGSADPEAACGGFLLVPAELSARDLGPAWRAAGLTCRRRSCSGHCIRSTRATPPRGRSSKRRGNARESRRPALHAGTRCPPAASKTLSTCLNCKLDGVRSGLEALRRNTLRERRKGSRYSQPRTWRAVVANAEQPVGQGVSVYSRAVHALTWREAVTNSCCEARVGDSGANGE